MEKRLPGDPKKQFMDVRRMYTDNGYLFFNVTPVELKIDGDSVDVEMRITEGKPATFNNIIINGNTITSEKIARRALYTRPGYLFSQSDFERSLRELASIGHFEAERAYSEAGYTLLPNQQNNTVDIAYNLAEKPNSQLELSGGWGGDTFVGTLGVSFNNFSVRRMFEKGAWRPVPLGDGQTLSVRFQTNGTYYTALSLSFMEPWLTGKKPTSLNFSAYYTRQTNSYYFYQKSDEYMEVAGIALGIGTRLKWPDDYFVLYNELSWQYYNLHNWNYNFLFRTGKSNNFSYKLSLNRNSTDQQIYPRSGSDMQFSVQLTPPYSLFGKDKDYKNMTDQEKYKVIEYHKWTFKGTLYTKLIGDLVLKTSANFGYLGYYNRDLGYSPFEGFQLGGDG
ncbi:MAG: BamA/TamA family outer membrane protein, partial [Bacteroidales bacterium]|nr:BamA/TamA family outer membrane protein [Bacteroidales bacterium]